MTKYWGNSFQSIPSTRICMEITKSQQLLRVCKIRPAYWQYCKLFYWHWHTETQALTGLPNISRLRPHPLSGVMLGSQIAAYFQGQWWQGNIFYNIEPSQSVGPLIWLCHWCSIGIYSQQEDGKSPKQRIHFVQVEKFNRQDFNESVIDCVEDAWQKVANEWKKNERLPSKDIWEGAGNCGEEEKWDSSNPAGVHLE